MRIPCWNALLLGTALLLAGAAKGATVVGRVNGTFEATATGAVAYTIPIEVASGLNGLRPSVALAYNSQSAQADAGAGWSLAGFAEISRCPLTRAVDGRVQGVRFTRQDRFCLDGQPLVLTAGSYGASGAQYRTEVHAYEVVTSVGTQGTGPLYFELRRPDGLVYRFGNDADSRIEAPGTGEVRTWAINEVEDRFGQRMAFQYAEDDVGGEHHPVEVRWTYGPGETPLQARYRLSFSWEPRPAGDRRSGFLWGAPWLESKRLAAIEYAYDAGSGFARVHRYALNYATPGAGGSERSHLAEVAVCGPRDCLPPTTFQWDDGPAGHNLVAVSGVPVERALPGDFNGDGATDIFAPYAGRWAVWPADPQTGGYLAPVVIGGSVAADSVAMILDYNGDGLADLMTGSSQGPNWLVYQAPATPGGAFVVRNTGVGVAAGADITVLDMDGDELDDLAYVRNAQVFFRRNTGGAFAAEKSAGLAAVAAPNTPWPGSFGFLETGDFDGDGRVDLLVARSQTADVTANYLWEMFLSNGGGFGPAAVATFTTQPTDGKILVLDLNGDGLSDVLRYTSVGWSSYLSRGTASGGLAALVPQDCMAPPFAPSSGVTVALDYDGDGRSDILQPAAGGRWRAYLSDGACVDTTGRVVDLPVATSNVLNRALPVDADGDGNTDVLFGSTSTNAGSLLRFVPPARPDGRPAAPRAELLRQVADGLGNEASFEYLPLSQVAGYAPAGTNPPNSAAVRGGSLPVLTRYSATGAGSYEVRLAYAGGKRDTQGRGFLGFESVSALDSRNGLTTVTQFRQDFPFAGRIEALATWDQDRRVSLYDPAWAAATVAAPDAALDTHFVYLAGDLAESYEVDADGGQRGSLVRAVRRSLGWNLAHGAVSSEVTEVSSPMSAGQVFRRTRSVSFDEAARGSGCLGLPSRVEVTSDVSGAVAQSRSSVMTYDAATCRLASQLDGPPAAPSQQLRTTYTYDAAGRTETVTRADAAGAQPARITRFGYDARGSRPLTEAQLIGGEADYVVGRAWNDALGLETGRADPGGMVTGWLYDDFGRVRTESRSTGSTRTTYTACGPCFAPGARYAIRQTRSDGFWSETQHDSLGRVVGRASVLADGRSSRQLLQYDGLGRLKRQSTPFLEDAPAVYWSAFGYDLLGRLKSLDQPGSEALPAGVLSTYTYAGLDTVVRNAAGQATAFRSDAAGRVIRVTDALGGLSAYAYDALGQLTSVVDASGHARRFAYDDRGFLAESDDPDAGRRSFAYDAFGQLVRQSDGKSPANVMTLQYDQLGRVVSRTEPEGTTTWTYVAAGPGRGLLQKVTAPTDRGNTGFQEAYLYNARGQLQRTTTTIDGSSYDTDYAYGSEGKLAAMTYPTTVGWRPRFLLGYAYGHLTTITQEGLGLTPVYTLMEMDAQGRDAWAAFGNSALEERNVYDAATGRVAAIRSGTPAAPASVQDYAYEWSPTGNLVSRRNRLAATPRHEQFTYDDLDRLVEAKLNGVQTLTMSYEADGNILFKSDVGGYGYGAGGRHPHGVTVISGGPRAAMSFSYDANGNMTSRDGSPVTWTSFNLPRQVNQGADYARFAYGPDRTRISQEARTGQATKTILYVGPHFEVETEGTTRRYRATVFAYGRAVYSQVETASGGVEAYYVLHDHLGSIDRLVRAAGTGADLLPLSFDAWGKRRFSGWGPDYGDLRYGDDHWVERGFTGHEHLDNLRLVHMNGRLQDPLTGRMLSPDPVAIGTLATQALNPYSYVGNNPASYFDPSGYLFGKLRKAIKRGLRHIGAFGQRLIRRWGRPVLAAVAGYYTAGTVSSWAYAAQASSAGAAAGAAGGIAAADTLTAAAASSAVIGGAAGGAVAGAIGSGSLRGMAAGAVTGGLMGGVAAQFRGGYGAGRVLAEAAVGGLGAELQGGDFRDGFIASGTLSTLSWAAVEMRRAMVEQSRLNGAGNAGGISEGFRGDGFKLGGCRAPCDTSPLGGAQRGRGQFFGMGYEPGSFLDHLIETYAGPHDFLNAPLFYDSLGNNVGRPAIFNAVNVGNVLLATPFAAASVIPSYAYGAFDD